MLLNKKIIPYGHQWIDKADINAVVKILKSDWLTQGPVAEKFEKAVAKYCGAKYGVAFSSGTSALYCAYRSAEIKQGDEVITSPLTFAATSNMLAMLGAVPVFVDIQSDTLNIDPELVEGHITKKTKAIVAIDFAGHPCDYDEILKIAKKHNLLLIEDACHALGAEYNGKKIGSFADMTVLSFHPVKHITTGEGGMVLTNSKDFYEKLKLFRNHGIEKKPEKGGWYYEISEPSFNFRITDFQCALGISQLKKIGKFLKDRRGLAKKYNKELAGIEGIKLPIEKDYAKSAWHLYVIQVKNRKKLFGEMQKQGIGVQVHYMPLHLHPFFQNKFGYKKGDFPVAEQYYKEAVSLPIFYNLNKKDFEKVIKIIKNYVKK